MARRGWEFTQNAKKRWYLQVPEGLAAEEYPSVADIRERAQAQGIDPSTLLSDEAMEKGLRKALAVPGEEFSFPVAIDPAFDARVIVSPDKTAATLYIRKSTENRDLIDLRLISNLLNNSRVAGLDPVKIKSAIDAFRASPAMELEDLVIAEGTPPGRGKNRELVPQVAWLEGTDRARVVDHLSRHLRSTGPGVADAELPLADATGLASVEKGQIVYGLSPAELGSPGVDVYGKEIPGLPGNDPFVQLVENLTLGPAGIRADASGVLVAAEKNGALKLRVVPYRDASVTATVSPDGMIARLSLSPGEGAGVQLSPELVTAALTAKGVTGVGPDRIADAVSKAASGPVDIVVKKGKRPTPPGGIKIEWLVDESVDGAPVPVSRDARILAGRLVPGGEDGFDVRGAALPASGAPPASIPNHDATIRRAESEGNTVLVAAASGELTLSGGKLSIATARSVSGDVDEKTGDVSFPGDLSVAGAVRKERSVKAGGNLAVKGDAEMALLSADGNVSMEGGIRGAGRGTVWARQEIRLGFAENARLLAGKDIVIGNYCFQCVVKTNARLVMNGNPGVLLGGSVHASQGIEVFELGSAKTIRTVVSFGQSYLVSDQIEVCEKEIGKIKETVAAIDAEMKKIPASDPRIHELRRRKLDLLKKNDKLAVRVFMLKEQFENHIISHVRVQNTVYPGVILESHGRYYEVKKQMSHVVFIFDQIAGQIVCSPIAE